MKLPIDVTADSHENGDLAVTYGHLFLSGTLRAKDVTVENSNECPGTVHIGNYTPLIMGVVGVSLYVTCVAIKLGDETTIPVFHPFEH